MNNNYPAPSSRGLKLGKDELLAVLCCLIWGSCPPITKMSYAWYCIGSGDVTSMMLMAGIRFIISGCIIVAFIYFSYKLRDPHLYGTALAAMRISAIETPLCLCSGKFLGIAESDLVKVARSFDRILFGHQVFR